MSTRNPGDGNQPDNTEPEDSPAAQEPKVPEDQPSEPDRSKPGSESEGADRSTADPTGQPESAPPQRFSTPPRSGSVQRQEPGVTQPRPPTVAEARARDKARRRAEDAQRAVVAADQAKKRTRKRMMMGGVAIVGVAGLVGGGYLAYRAITAPDQVTASCVKVEDGKEVVVDDDYCGDGRPGFVGDGGGVGTGLIILGGGPQYRYYYGGANTVGRAPSGGTTVKPKSAEIKTKTGTTVQRGGLGSKSTSGGS